MIDARFFRQTASPSAAELAEWTGAKLVRGDPDRRAVSVAAAAMAGAGDVTFLEEPLAKDDAGRVAQVLDGAIVFANDKGAASIPAGATVLWVRRPRSAFSRATEAFLIPRQLETGEPARHPSADIGDGAILEPGCVIGPDVAIGAGARIGANAVIGPGVQIGARTRIGANASISCALIGDGVIILPGAVIGEGGFGLAADASGAFLVPHFGRVIIQNGASIGANSCIDRGMFEDTIIGEGSHIDNMCHIAHNCRVGRNVAMAAFAGISGSVSIGDGAQFGGRVGIADHVSIGEGARLAAGSAVMREVPPGDTHGGYPAKPIRTWMRELAWLAGAAQKRSGS